MNDTETFQHYQVLKREDGSLWELGRGAMGVTYKAFDTNLRCEVALKVISAQFLDSEMARARFLREARAAAGLRHRNVASVYHLGNDTDSFFYSMEFIDGLTVESLVANQGPLPPTQALQIALQVTRALGAAAKQGVVHRDIKPANLMVVHEDEDEEQGFMVKVIDFGLARSAMAGGENSGHITMGGFVGTPQYASPEQIEEKDLDVRSDIYSLGITLWYMLAGQPPFTGTVFRISSQHLTKEPPWDSIEGTVPPGVRALLGRMLQKDPALRPQTPAKLRAEIDECLRGLPADAAAAGPGGPLVPSDSDTAFPEDGQTASVTIIQGPAPSEGRIFAGRYQLVERVGEGASGQTFRAYDGRLDGKLVALKVLDPALSLSPQAFYHLQGDLGRLRDSPHPQLIETFGLERVHGYKFSVMEWVHGYPLAEAIRPGKAWSLPDALRLLGLLADAAQHCSAHRLHRLELSPHKILLGFPEVGEDDPPPVPAALADRPLDQWPPFTVKVDALAPAREAARGSARGSGTGSAPRLPGRDTLSSIRGLVEGSYFYALGVLVYELLGAAPPTGVEGAPEFPPLPALPDEGNAVLARAFSTNPGFGTENEWFAALLAACGLRREEIGLARPLADEPSPTSVRATARASGSGGSAPAPPATRPGEGRATPVRPPTESRARAATPPPPAPASIRPTVSTRPPPEEAHTLTHDRADTFVPPARPAAPVEARERPAPPVSPPMPVSVPEPAAPPPLAAPPAETPAQNGSAGAAEAATFVPEAAPAQTFVQPVRQEAAPEAPPVLAEAATLAPRERPVPPPAPAVSGAADGPPRSARKFSLVPVLAAVAVLLVGGLAAVFALSRPRPAATGTEVRPVVVRTPVAESPGASTPAASAGTGIPPVETPAPTSDTLAVEHPPTPGPVLASPSPTAVPSVLEPTAEMEAVSETPAPTVVPTPTVVSPPEVIPPPTPSPSVQPTPTPRRDREGPVSAPTPKAARPSPTPPKGRGAGQADGKKAKPTPAKPLKATPPPRKDEDAPDFMH